MDIIVFVCDRCGYRVVVHVGVTAQEIPTLCPQCGCGEVHTEAPREPE